MSSSEFGQEVPEINDRSTIPELLGLLLSSFREKEFKLFERILISREEELKRQLKKEQEKRSLLEKIHGESELEKLEIQEELKRLKGEKLGEADQCQRLKRENFEMQEEMKRLKNEKLEMLEELKKLKREKQEAEKTAQLYSQKFPEYEERSTSLQKAVASVLGIDVSDIGTRCACNSSENDLPKEASTSINRICHKEFHDKGQLVLEKSTQVVPSHIPISDRPQSPIVVEIIESDDEAPGDEKPYVSNTCTPEVNSSKKGVTFMEAGRSGCPTQTEDGNKSNVMSNPLKNLLPKRKRSLTKSDDSDSTPVGKQKTKAVRELLHDGKDFIVNNRSVKLDSAATGSPSILPSAQGQMVNKRCQEKAGADCSLQTASRKFDVDNTDDSSDYSSTDSEDEHSDSYINNMIASLRRDCPKSQKTWNFAADMLSEFQKDNELCMNAVCALYRKKISAEKSINYTSSPINLGFYWFNAMSGRNLAEYLIGGDPQNKLKRTVSEVQQKDSRLLDRCKDIAIHYYQTLFEIYRKKEDPFFHPRS